MDTLLLYLIFSLLAVCFLVAYYLISYNKIQDSIIRIDEVEANIDNILRNKYDALNRAIAIIKGNVKVNKEIFEEIVRLRSRKISNFELDRKLVSASMEFMLIKEEHKDLFKDSEEIKKIAKTLTESDDKLAALKQYYNENISTYNKLIKSFPTNIIAKFNHYQDKLFFDKKDMSDDDFKDFKL